MILVASLGILFIPFSQAQSKARVDLENQVVLIEEIAAILVTLNAKGEQILVTENEVTFPPILSFLGAEPGEAGQAVSAVVKAELVEAADQSLAQKLILRIRRPDGEPLPDGVLALLKFQVKEQIVDQDSLDLTLKNKVSVLNSEGRRVSALGKAAGLTVMKDPPPVFVCFFYMH